MSNTNKLFVSLGIIECTVLLCAYYCSEFGVLINTALAILIIFCFAYYETKLEESKNKNDLNDLYANALNNIALYDFRKKYNIATFSLKSDFSFSEREFINFQINIFFQINNVPNEVSKGKILSFRIIRKII